VPITTPGNHATALVPAFGTVRQMTHT